MKTVLVFGAGKSATVLVDYLLKNAELFNWQLLLVDADLALASSKLGHSTRGKAYSFDVLDSQQRTSFIEKSDLVISLLPPQLHIEVAKDCLLLGKNLLTASYINPAIRELESQIKAKRILFLCEMGLDPGIDHMSALSLLDAIREKGGHVTSFISHCGGLVAPESDNNPWHYKISWNPRNVVTAGREGAKFKQGGDTVVLNQQEIFSEVKRVSIEGAGEFAWYPNRDSLSYISLYGLEQTKNFIRTTLRHPGYVKAWKNILELELTHDKPVYTLSHPNLKKAFDHHFREAGKTAKVDQLQSEDAGFAKQLQFLGVADEETILPFENFTPAQLLQFSLENKLLLAPQDKDMIVMLHEINYQLAGKSYDVKSSLVVKGTDAFHTAMAKTVGLPLGIMASLLLKEKIKLIGLKVPIEKEIYQPVLAALEAEGICFRDTEVLLAD
jgi:saccharopine dehydrogenase-like NADP-dependent oxidoreductase